MSFHAFLGGSPTMFVGSVLTWAPWRFNFLLTWVFYSSFLARMIASSNAMHPLCPRFRDGLRCITRNCDIARHLSFLSWFHVYLVSKGVYYEMFNGYVVDTQCKLRYLKSFGELKDLLFDLLWCYVSSTQKDEIHQN